MPPIVTDCHCFCHDRLEIADREGVRNVVENTEGMTIVGEASNGEDAVSQECR